MSLPKILQQLNGGSPTPLPTNQISQIKNMVNLIKNANNPQALLQSMMAKSSPQLQQAMDYVQSHGGDPKTAFYKLAEEKGINPQEIENMLK